LLNGRTGFPQGGGEIHKRDGSRAEMGDRVAKLDFVMGTAT
jgi:hypothetical protein